MTRDEAVTRMQRILGFRSDLTTELQDALKDAQAELEREPVLPWFLLTEIASITTTTDEERIPLPSDFLGEWDDGTLWRFDSAETLEWKRLRKDDLEFLRKKWPGSGEPNGYSIDAKYFRLIPVPDKAYTIKQIYYAKDTVLSTNVENQWLLHAHDLMIGKAGLKVAVPARDQVAVKEFQRMERDGRRRVYMQDQARMHANRRYVMGGED